MFYKILYLDLQKLRRTLLAPGQPRGPAGAGYQDPGRMLRRVTLTNYYRRAVSKNELEPIGIPPYLDSLKLWELVKI